MRDRFERFAGVSSHFAGHPVTFVTAVALLVAWAFTGPILGFSNTWQLMVNTATTIVTFLMVFLIQNTQNRDSEAVHIKLDELLRALEGARTDLLDAEESSTKELGEVHERFRRIAEQSRHEQ